MNAWLFQDSRQKAALGDKCPWSVGWYDADGRKRSKKVGTKSVAEKYRKQVEAKLALELCTGKSRTKWKDFRKQFIDTALVGKALGTVEQYEIALDNFERLVSPVYVDSVTTAMIDSFKAKRSRETQRPRVPKAQSLSGLPAKRPSKPKPDASPPAKISPATVNKDLRHLRAALVKAKKWKMLAESPEFEMLPVPQRDPYFIDDDTFKALYDACDTMTRPDGRHYAAADWWKALLAFAYLTGWRIGEILDLRRDDVDLETGVARVAAEGTKGRREARVELPAIVVEHVRAILDFQPLVFD